jgi:hypothetical protein
MANAVQIIRVVVASPCDVQAERDIVTRIVEEVNRGMAADRGLRLEVARWETDSYPGFDAGGHQGVIGPILRIDRCDLLIGIFWKRLGTPTTDAKSGTEHEFRLAYESWQKSGRPQVMIYFNQKPYPPPQTEEEVVQSGWLVEFKKTFPKEGLWWPYKGAANFEKVLRNHLSNFVRTELPAVPAKISPEKLEATPRAAGRPPDYFAVQSDIVEKHARLFVGRSDAQKAFERFLGTQRRGYFILRAGPGQGKTAFSCHLLRQGKYVHHFISRTVYAKKAVALESLGSILDAPAWSIQLVRTS